MWFIWLIAIIIFLVILYAIFRTRIKGAIGEFTVNLCYRLFLPRNEYILHKNVIIVEDGKTRQIDHLLVSRYGIFVVETKNYSGKIYGSEHAEQFTQYVGRQVNKFYSPIKQNNGHIYGLKQTLGDYPYFSIIVFRKAKVKFEGSTYVGSPIGSVFEIKRHKHILIYSDTVEEIENKLAELDKSGSISLREHVNSVKSENDRYEQSINDGICPRCGGKLVVRNGEYGKFIGCSNYPRCKFRRNMND